MIGQIHFNQGERSARLDFIAPEKAAGTMGMTALLEALSKEAGEWGAFFLLAEIEEHCPAFESLRRASFSVYAWQRIWKLPTQPIIENDTRRKWQVAGSEQEIAVRNLFQALVPPLVQSAEQLTSLDSRSLVYMQDGEALAYLEGSQGPQGIYLQPIIHPSVENVDDLIKEIPSHLPRLNNRPVYLAVRSYQSWLEPALEDMAAQVSPRQAVMVKHLANVQPVAMPAAARMTVLENRHPEPSAPIVQNFSTDKK
jgi:hypothetical protein